MLALFCIINRFQRKKFIPDHNVLHTEYLIPLLFHFFTFSGVNNGLLDSYQLKSLDGVVEGSLKDVHFEKRGNHIHVSLKNISTNDNFALRKKYDHVIRCLGFNFDESIFNRFEKHQ